MLVFLAFHISGCMQILAQQTHQGPDLLIQPLITLQNTHPPTEYAGATTKKTNATLLYGNLDNEDWPSPS